MFRLVSLAFLVALAQGSYYPLPNGYAPSYPMNHAPLKPAAYPARPSVHVIPAYGGFYPPDIDSSSLELQESSEDRRRDRIRHQRRQNDCGRLQLGCALTDGVGCHLPEITYYWDRNLKKAYIDCKNYDRTQPWGIATLFSTVNDLAIGIPATKIAVCDRFGIWRAPNAYYNNTLEFNGVRCLIEAQKV